MKSILITGGTGYIGGQLTSELLSQNYIVHWLVRHPGEAPKEVVQHVVNSSFEMAELFRVNRFDLTIHLAAKAQYSWSESTLNDHIESNFQLGVWLLEAMSLNDCRKLINTTSYWEDFSSEERQPNCLYAALKKAFRVMVDFYCFNSGLKCISLRLFDVYGPGDKRKKIFTAVAEAATLGKPINLSKGEQLIYWTHIHDVCEAYLKAVKMLDTDKVEGHMLFDVRGVPLTLKSAVEKFIKVKSIAGVQLNWGAIEYNKNQIMNPVILETLPGWQPKTHFEASLKEL
jgi:nucleoside-diphosphate-sugar epimerase